MASGARAALFIFVALLDACAPQVAQRTPPDTYKGPIAEGPTLQIDDYWIYRRPDGSRVKTGAGSTMPIVEFPLWVGRTWTYRTDAVTEGQPRTTRARALIEITCEATRFESIVLPAGSFDAFRCQCECAIVGESMSDRFCFGRTIWYAPRAKNIVKIEDGSSTGSFELTEYKTSDVP